MLKRMAFWENDKGKWKLQEGGWLGGEEAQTRRAERWKGAGR